MVHQPTPVGVTEPFRRSSILNMQLDMNAITQIRKNSLFRRPSIQNGTEKGVTEKGLVSEQEELEQIKEETELNQTHDKKLLKQRSELREASCRKKTYLTQTTLQQHPNNAETPPKEENLFVLPDMDVLMNWETYYPRNNLKNVLKQLKVIYEEINRSKQFNLKHQLLLNVAIRNQSKARLTSSPMKKLSSRNTGKLQTLVGAGRPGTQPRNLCENATT